MKKLFASTAMVLAMTTLAHAEAHTASPFAETTEGKVLYTSDLVGARLYVSEPADGDLEARADWDDVGEIYDIILGTDGEVKHVLVDIGGFLGIGEKRVAVSMDALEIVSDGEGNTDYFVVFRSDRDALENAPTFEAMMEEAEETAESAAEEVEQTAEAAAAEVEETAEEMRLAAPEIDIEGYQSVEMGELTAEELTGARVYDVTDKWIGEVHELVLTNDGQVSKAIIDVGGFLGIGEKRIGLSLDEVSILNGDGDVRVYVDASKDVLMELPEWEG